MNRTALTYSEEYFEVDRPRPLFDGRMEKLQGEILDGKIEKDITDKVYDDFKYFAEKWIFSSSLNNLTGIETFSRTDIIIGCTQFIDNIYMQGPVQVLREDYRYHQRLGLAYVKDVGSLIPDIPLIIAMPFPSIGSPHHDMEEILEESRLKNIHVHIDGAWVTCCRDVVFDFSDPVIKSVGISLSKGLGLGWNRVGLRWTRQLQADSISIMNDFNMNNRALAMIGLHYLKNLPVDYLWSSYEQHYNKVCVDFNLEKTNCIYLALKNGQPIGIAPLIRYLINHGI